MVTPLRSCEGGEGVRVVRREGSILASLCLLRRELSNEYHILRFWSGELKIANTHLVKFVVVGNSQ